MAITDVSLGRSQMAGMSGRIRLSDLTLPSEATVPVQRFKVANREGAVNYWSRKATIIHCPGRVEVHSDGTDGAEGKWLSAAITVDESWLFLYNPHGSVWAASRNELPQRIEQDLTRKSGWFQFFGGLTESTVF
jgi:hypothetical protein